MLLPKSYGPAFALLFAGLFTVSFPQTGIAQPDARGLHWGGPANAMDAIRDSDGTLAAHRQRADIRDHSIGPRSVSRSDRTPRVAPPGALIGSRSDPARTVWLDRPYRYDLPPLTRGLGYARRGDDIYIMDRETGVILGVAAVVAAARD